jgi:hypothetical protein
MVQEILYIARRAVVTIPTTSMTCDVSLITTEKPERASGSFDWATDLERWLRSAVDQVHRNKYALTRQDRSI